MQHSHDEFHTQASCCHGGKKQGPDYLLWGSAAGILLPLAASFLVPLPALQEYAGSSLFFLKEMWWGIALGVVTVGMLGNIPRGLMESLLTTKTGKKSILRALAAGLLLDMCNHGIVLIGTKLYERGASLGQLFAFLIASPWNSFSLTLILFSLIGFKLTLAFIFLSLVIGFISGHAADLMVKKGLLPQHPHNKGTLPNDLGAEWKNFKSTTKRSDWNPLLLLKNGLRESLPIIRWMLLGVVIAGLMRTFLPEDFYHQWLGPTLIGLGVTLVFATVIEVCSEGSVPIASDILTRAGAVGNGFAFLMAGASTDYTEIAAIREATKSWKAGFFLPLVTLPQIILLAYLLN